MTLLGEAIHRFGMRHHQYMTSSFISSLGPLNPASGDYWGLDEIKQVLTQL